MATWNEKCVVITESGEYLFSQGIVDNKIEITRIVAGSNRNVIADLKNQTAIANIKATGSVSRVVTSSTGVAIVIAISNEEITEEYELNQIGIYAKSGSSGEILYMIAQAEVPDTIPLYSVTPTTVTFDVSIVHSQDLSIIITGGATGLATLNDVLPLIQEALDAIDTHTQASVYNNQSGIHDLRTPTKTAILEVKNAETGIWESARVREQSLSNYYNFI